MNNYAHIAILAGENSGDQIAADLVNRMNSKHKGLCWQGMGGPAMQNAGVKLCSDYRDFAIMGYLCLFSRLRGLVKLIKKWKKLLKEEKPAILICVDYPGFNLMMAKYAKRLGIRVIYYVCPKTWASRENRVKKLKKHVDQCISILPFEKDYFSKWDLPVTYVGHPLLDKINTSKPQETMKHIVLMPGSREGEIKRLAPIMCAAAMLLHQRHQASFTIRLAHESQMSLLQRLFEPLLARDCVKISNADAHYLDVDYAIVASGTATLELCKRGIPMQVVYRMDALTYALAKHLVKVPYISLCNLIANSPIVPELIQEEATEAGMVAAYEQLQGNPDEYREMQAALAQVIEKVGPFREDLLLDAIGPIQG